MSKRTELISAERRELHCELLSIEKLALKEAWLPVMRHHRLSLLATYVNEELNDVGDEEIDAASNIEVAALFALAETPPCGSDLILRLRTH
jgi:hypothetical protein